jgi:hypothetical protein
MESGKKSTAPTAAPLPPTTPATSTASATTKNFDVTQLRRLEAEQTALVRKAFPNVKTI